VKILEQKDYIFLFHFAIWCGWTKRSIPVVHYIDSVYSEEISTFGIEGSISDYTQIDKLNKLISDYDIGYPVCLEMKNENIENVLPLYTTGFPSFLLIDNKRRLLYKQIGNSDILIDSVAFYLTQN
jgi:thiol-disulfide isomerase/thioredoxin